MILTSFDIETTGLNKTEDRIIEMGLVLYSTGQSKILRSEGFLLESAGVPVTEEITDLTGITASALEVFGYDQIAAIETFLEYAELSDAVIGHNSNFFDLPVIENTAKRLDVNWNFNKLCIDTMTDIPGVKGEQLITMCAKHGFVNPNQHSAEDDAKAVLKLISGYSIDKIVERAKSPLVVIKSAHSRSDTANKAARKAGFRWNPDYRIWWQAVKEMDLEQFAKGYSQGISRVEKEITLEYLREN